MNNAPIFHEPAVCLTKFGPESGENRQRNSRKERSGRENWKERITQNEFWWGIGEKGTAETICHLVRKIQSEVDNFRRS